MVKTQNMFGMCSITCSVMELLCCVPVRDSNKLYEKHVLTLTITFSVAVMDGQDPNMFGMCSTTCSVMELLCCVPSEAVMQVL